MVNTSIISASNKSLAKLIALKEYHQISYTNDFQHISATLILKRTATMQKAAEQAAASLKNSDIKNTIKNVGKTVEAAYSIGWAFGINLDAFLTEIQRANMSKLLEDGTALFREDGKVLKGPNFKPVDFTETMQHLQKGTALETRPQEAVHAFHKATNSIVADSLATVISPYLGALRSTLILEEVKEASDELILFGATEFEITKACSELADVLYVCYGTGVSLGFNVDASLVEV